MCQGETAPVEGSVGYALEQAWLPCPPRWTSCCGPRPHGVAALLPGAARAGAWPVRRRSRPRRLRHPPHDRGTRPDPADPAHQRRPRPAAPRQHRRPRRREAGAHRTHHRSAVPLPARPRRLRSRPRVRCPRRRRAGHRRVVGGTDYRDTDPRRPPRGGRPAPASRMPCPHENPDQGCGAGRRRRVRGLVSGWDAAVVVAADLLDPLRPAVVGGVTFLVDRARPVAGLRVGGLRRAG